MDDHVSRIQAQWRREMPGVDVTPQGVFGRLHRLANVLRTELVTVYARYGLGEGEFDILATLRRSDGHEQPAGALASHTMVTSGAVSKRLDRLERAGLVERRVDDADGRGRLVRLTPKGHDLIGEAFVAHIDNEHELLEALAPGDRVELERILRTWLRAYEEPPTEDPTT